MNKITKRIVAGASAMILTFGNMAMTAGAASGTGYVDGITVTYSTTIKATSSESSSIFLEDPTRYDFALQLSIAYQCKNQRTGVVNSSLVKTPKINSGGLVHQITAPTGYVMVKTGTNHTFWVDNGIGTVFYSEAVY